MAVGTVPPLTIHPIRPTSAAVAVSPILPLISPPRFPRFALLRPRRPPSNSHNPNAPLWFWKIGHFHLGVEGQQRSQP
jgi:hypothetical protein